MCKSTLFSINWWTEGVTYYCRNTDKKEEVFAEAESRLNVLVQKNFKTIAQELEFQDPYLYLRAYTAGLQEFIEALVFYLYLRKNTITTWSDVNKGFIYQDEDTDKTVTLLFPQVDFILGIADFTGELMRKCINSLGAGNIGDCFKICNFVKYIYTGFLGETVAVFIWLIVSDCVWFAGINNIGYKEINRKMYVLRQSLSKMELVCYNICVRGSEVPKHMLMNVITSADDDNHEEDEGFF